MHAYTPSKSEAFPYTSDDLGLPSLLPHVEKKRGATVGRGGGGTVVGGHSGSHMGMGSTAWESSEYKELRGKD
jgi:hypothetical protein